jgi:cytochrome P450
VWTRVRKSTTPSFSNLNISLKFPSIVNEIYDWMKRLKEEMTPSKNSAMFVPLFDMKYEAFTLTIRIITVMAFGLSTDDPICAYFFSVEFQNDIIKIFKFMGVSSVWALPRFLWKYSSQYQHELEGLECARRLTKHCQEMINYKRKIIEECQKEGKPLPVSMLDSLLINEHSNTSEKALNDEEVIANVIIFYLGGTDTTSVTISWIPYYFSQHPEIAQKVREEAKSILFHNDDPAKALASIDLNRMKELKYCSAVVKETLRLVGPAPAVVVELTETEKKVGATLSNGIEIAGNDLIWINIDGIHRDPTIFANPNEFQPERWLTDDPTILSAMESAFIPFGYGTRVCPGMNLALNEVSLAIAFLAYYYDFQLGCELHEITRIANFVAMANQMPIYLNCNPDAYPLTNTPSSSS